MDPQSAIVVEGGAMRGVFSAGVLDVFHEQGFHPFSLAIGVSAGACTLASHLAGQHGRNRRSYLDVMTRPEFLDARRLLRRESMLDLDWLWDTLAQTEPLDVSAVLTRGTRFVVVATDATTGMPVYLDPDAGNMFEVLKGSCALPLLYRPRITVAGQQLVDGGVSDPIPVEAAYRAGARRIVVVRSRMATAVKRTGFTTHASAALLLRQPTVARAMLGTAGRYQAAVRFLNSPPPDCQIIHVAPPTPLASGRTSRNRAGLAQDYALGRSCGLQAIARYQASSPGGMPTHALTVLDKPGDARAPAQ